MQKIHHDCCDVSRRTIVRAGLTGLAAVSLSDVLRLQAHAGQQGRGVSRRHGIALTWRRGPNNASHPSRLKPD